jgi:uncharacterized phiE125 gp8 family phage protein
MIVYSRVTDKAESYAVTLDEVKTHLRVDGSDEDALIFGMIGAATRICEGYTGLSFMTQTRTVKLDRLKGDVNLPYGPVQSITSIAYKDEDGLDQTLDDTGYIIDLQSRMSKVRASESWPYTNRSLNNVVITYVAGHESAEDVPFEAKEAIKKVVSRLYQNRGDDNSGVILTPEIIDLLDCIKVYWDAEY